MRLTPEGREVVERELREAVERARRAYLEAPLAEREAAGEKLVRALEELSRFIMTR
jgi:hypothetical protein